jgi:hypothetical protein
VLSENEVGLKEYEVVVSNAFSQNPISVFLSSNENLSTSSIPVSLDINFSKDV